MDFRRKRSKISRTQAHILRCRVPPKKIFSAEILGKTIESAEVHYTKPEDEFRWGIGLNTKFRREKKNSAEVRYTICVVEFRWKLKYTKVRIFFATNFGAQDPNFPPKKKHQQKIWDPGPHNRPQTKKASKVRRGLFGKKNLRLQFKVLSPEQALPIGHLWHMWSGGTFLGNGWKIVWTWWWAI